MHQDLSYGYGVQSDRPPILLLISLPGGQLRDPGARLIDPVVEPGCGRDQSCHVVDQSAAGALQVNGSFLNGGEVVGLHLFNPLVPSLDRCLKHVRRDPGLQTFRGAKAETRR